MSESKNRIIYLDILRAIAVLLMVEGHTVDTFLADSYRTTDSLAYSIWITIRGFTAPIFMFTAGVVFTYLLRSNPLPFHKNPRVKKGIKRFFVLIGIGYLLRYPTHTVVDFSDVTQKQWMIFFGIDALHIIGFGILFVVALTYLSEKFGNRDYLLYSIGSAFFFLLTPFVNSLSWDQITPLPIASLLTRTDTGSIFPLFPWAGYISSGAILGTYLAGNKGVQFRSTFGLKLLTIGSLLVLLFFFFRAFGLKADYDFTSLEFVLIRVGVVLILNGLLSLAALKISKIPQLLKDIGRHTLSIYVVHLIILYGCAWVPSIYYHYGKSFDPITSAFAAAIMLSLMIGMTMMIVRFHYFKRRSIAFVNSIVSYFSNLNGTK